MKYKNETVNNEGWTNWIRPYMHGYKFCCCDCGLVHFLQFRIVPEDFCVEFRVKRDNRATGQSRRWKEMTDHLMQIKPNQLKQKGVMPT